MVRAADQFYTDVVTWDTLQRVLQRLTSGAYNAWEVGIELLLIALCVNWCANVLHGTRGTRLLRGLLIVLVVITLIVRVLAEQLGWSRLELLYRYVVVGLALIALVAFQPELRRALIRAGDVRLFRRPTQKHHVVASLVEAAGYLSRNKFGGLIAIQREVGLASWAENGVQIGAQVSADLLKNIFYPNSALHDLGVIIRGNRIVAASCQFPAAESGELDTSLGSRHRAAVGLSSESDALVLVISEETGTISIADQGELTRFLPMDELEEELEQRLSKAHFMASTARGWIRSLSDFWRVFRRLLVVAPLSVVIWLLADQASQIAANDIEIALDVQRPTAESVVEALEPQSLQFILTLKGPTRAIDELRRSTALGPLSLQWRPEGALARVGEHILSDDDLRAQIDAIDAFRRLGVTVMGVNPPDMRYQVDERVTIEVPIVVDAGTLNVTSVQIDPPVAQATVRGMDLAKLPANTRVIRAPIGKRLATQPQDEPVVLENVVLDPQLDGVRALDVAPRTATVRLVIVGERIRRTLEPIPVRILTDATLLSNWEITQPDLNEWILSLELTGERAQLAELEPSDIEARVRIDSAAALGDSADVRAAEVELILPPGVSLVGPPRTVRYELIARDRSEP